MVNKHLIYIIGAGRSGTTILDIILGNINDGISLGEINRYFKRKGIPPKRNKKDETSIFWRKFKQKIEDKDVLYNNYDECQKLLWKNEYHLGFIKALTGKTSAGYNKLINGFYSLLIELRDEKVLIESSKYPLRAINISRILNHQPVDLSFVYIKKNPIDVVKSFERKGLEQPAKGFWVANIYYLLINSLCELTIRQLRRRGFKVCEITFEKLTQNPIETLQKINIELGLDTSAPQEKISKGLPLHTGLMFDGNRIRLKDRMLLSSPEKNSLKMAPKDYITRAFNYLIYK